MAHIGTLKTLTEQCNDSKFTKAFDYLANTNLDEIFKSLKDGENTVVKIDGDKVFAIFQTYETKDLSLAKMEGHKKYIDIQYIHNGIEQILYSPIHRIVKEDDYDKERDLHFPKVADYSSFRLTAGMGCILYPEDLHAPCISVDAPSIVEKIVIKVAVE
ncbi:MAG: YhcH/YjgK/YiaL family protein [Carboxylicivirga sp.]|jgi:YhcH/YjgK/YiaL family protein|nr:YhcH/YjgK/YiaL family protein [Carboxylicivirga sp.]